MKNDLEVGSRIRKLREELHLSRDAFSENINISEAYLARLERGEKPLAMNTLLSICEYTNCSSDYLLFGNAEEREINKKMIRLINRLPEDILDLSYDIIRSIKAHSNI